MTRPITLRFQVRHVGQRSVQITPRWAGNGLAVHKPVTLNDMLRPKQVSHARGVWALTHIPSGYSAGRFYGNLAGAITFAQKWDEDFAAVAKAEVPRALMDAYRRDLAVASAGPSRADLIEAEV